MAKLNIKMTYPVPDEYLSQSMAAGNTATLDYLGPDFIWVCVEKEGDRKGKWNHQAIKTNYLDDGDIEDYDNEDQTAAIEKLPVPLDCIRIKIDCSKDAHICSLFAQPHCTGDDRGSYDKLPQVQDKLDDGTVYYERPADNSIPPDHVWNRDECVYDEATGEWDLVLQKTWASWEQIRENRNSELDLSDVKTLLPDGAMKDRWDVYRQALRDVPQVYAGKKPHTVPMPPSPEEEDTLLEGIGGMGQAEENPTEAPDPTAVAVPGA